MRALEFYSILKEKGFDFFCGVPCSILKDIISCIESQEKEAYVPALSEDMGMGICSGACMSGKKPVLLMQNSGLGSCVNAITSFNLIYKIPVLLLISWRGFKGKDAPEHNVMGRMTQELLEVLGIKYDVLSEENIRQRISNACEYMEISKEPYALILKKGIIG